MSVLCKSVVVCFGGGCQGLLLRTPFQEHITLSPLWCIISLWLEEQKDIKDIHYKTWLSLVKLVSIEFLKERLDLGKTAQSTLG